MPDILGGLLRFFAYLLWSCVGRTYREILKLICICID